jgi:hypothetical protein
VAEFMAYLAGLSFWAKLFKYFVDVNHVGKYYDRRYKIYMFEEHEQKKSILKNDSLRGVEMKNRSSRSENSV